MVDLCPNGAIFGHTRSPASCADAAARCSNRKRDDMLMRNQIEKYAVLLRLAVKPCGIFKSESVKVFWFVSDAAPGAGVFQFEISLQV